MDSRESSRCHHVVAMPYPGRGHINPIFNLCKILASNCRAENPILITLVLTEEWLGFIGSEPKPDNLRFSSIPNVVPSEMVRATDVLAFLDAVWTKMEHPFERLLDTELLEPPVTLILADTILSWAVRVGNRRNIPVASFWTMSSSMFSFLYHFDLLVQNGHSPINSLERGDERVDYLPGISSTRIADFPIIIEKISDTRTQFIEQLRWVNNAQYLLLSSVYELEPHVVDALAPNLTVPMYNVGPTIPYLNLNNSSSTPDYFQWLDAQPNASVLYVSLGSFLSVSSAQMDEIAAGLCLSQVSFFWVARSDANRLREASGDKGLVVPWCDQLKVLSHSSIGGFLTHCGWNSVQESLFSGVPALTFPIAPIDQDLNSKLIVEDWRIGLRMKKYGGMENSLSTRDEIARLVAPFMDLEGKEGKEMRRRAKDLQKMCQSAVVKGGSSEININSFISDITKCSLL